MNVSSQTKMIIDRLQCLWVAKYVLRQPFSGGRKRRGIFVCAGGMDRPEMFAGIHMTIRAVFGTLDVRLDEEMLYPHTDERGAILGHPAALIDAFSSGQNLVTGPAIASA
jgi:multimeric flavodoxin WrbA